MPVNKRQGGFTLLEIMVAMAIFSLLSLASWAVLSGVLRTQEQTRLADQRIRTLSQAMLALAADIQGYVPRRSRIDNAILALSNDAFTLTTYQPEPDECCTADLQRVRWFVENNTLYRAVARYPDNPQELTPTPVLDGITGMSFRYFLKTWQQPGGRQSLRFDDPTALPQALEITLAQTDGSTLVRRFLLNDSWPDGSSSTPEKADTAAKNTAATQKSTAARTSTP